MKPKFSRPYLDKLFSSAEYSQLVELSGILCGSEIFDPDEPDYGFPTPVFVLVESLVWFAQASRSGVWSYFEATPMARQQAMLRALEREAPGGFALQYAMGMRDWQVKTRMKKVERWMKAHEEENNFWLWRLAWAHRASIERICA
ncbi:MAG: hypothetical protein HYX75_04560 [Acidobacteria bacterium]|nr:hypothetical protein [Acidobacteriota bacterium]